MTDTAGALAQLHIDTSDILADIQYFATPLDETHKLLGDVQRLLKAPGDFNTKLKTVDTVVVEFRDLCGSAGWIPEVGEEAKAAEQFLGAAHDVLVPIRTTLTSIDSDLKPLRSWIAEVQKPVDKAWGKVAKSESGAEQVKNATAFLLAHYKGHPPRSVETCAAALDRPVHPVVRPLNDAKDEANAALNRVEKPLDAAWGAMKRFLDYQEFLDRVFGIIDTVRRYAEPIRRAVAEAVHYGKKKIEFLLSEVGRKLAPGTYRKVRALLDKMQRDIQALRKRIVDWVFGPIRDMVQRVEAEIAEKVRSLPAVQQLETLLDKVGAALTTVVHAIENMREPCRSLLTGTAAAPEPVGVAV